MSAFGKGMTYVLCSLHIVSYHSDGRFFSPFYWQLDACLHCFFCVNVRFQTSYELVSSVFNIGSFSLSLEKKDTFYV